MESVIVVDDQDNELGTMEKMEAHVKGVLHRAFSVVIFNTSGQMLLQQRAEGKYHSAGLWTNACCSHPIPGEPMEKAIQRRLTEEMGISSELAFSHKFIYKAFLDHSLIEYELDHVYTGVTDEIPKLNPAEVQACRYVDLDELKKDILENPESYTYWFRIIMNDPAFNFQGISL
jgi:isopentenyl-diphosphate Delta-isomerase